MAGKKMAGKKRVVGRGWLEEGVPVYSWLDRFIRCQNYIVSMPATGVRDSVLSGDQASRCLACRVLQIDKAIICRISRNVWASGCHQKRV